MNLDINGEPFKGLVNKEQITEALSSLTGVGDSFVILSQDDMYYIQTCGDKTSGFHVEYREGSEDMHFECTQTLSLQETIEVFHSYFEGSDDWKSRYPWKKMNMNILNGNGATGVSEMELEEQPQSLVLFAAIAIAVALMWFYLR